MHEAAANVNQEVEGKLLGIGRLGKQKVDYPTFNHVVELMAVNVDCRLHFLSDVTIGWTGKLFEEIATVLLKLLGLGV